MVAWVKPGDDFVVQTYDWTGGFIQNDESADDVRDIDLTIVHFLSGPIGVEGAEPGDLLVVDLLDVGALPESGDSTASSPRRTAADSSPTIFHWRKSRSGTSRGSIPIPAMCRG
jgi:acetamidase/formamidase